MNITSRRNPDGTLTASIQPTRPPFVGLNVVQMALPAGLIHGQLAGRYFLARCGAQSDHERLHNWSIYARRPLFVAHARSPNQHKFSRVSDHEFHRETELPDLWTLALPPDTTDPGGQWLRDLAADATVNLIGPLGTAFTLDRRGLNLALIADAASLPRLLPLMEPALDRRCRVTLLVLDDAPSDRPRTSFLDLLPLAAELQLADNRDEFAQLVATIIPWADQLCVADPGLNLGWLAQTVRERRLRLEANYAQILVEADLLCGVGACLACVIPLANGGLTRACVHGPVMDLAHLAR